MTRNAPIWLTVLNWIADADRRFREAQKLKSLSDEHLADMGMTRADADRAFLRKPVDRPADRAPLPLSRHA